MRSPAIGLWLFTVLFMTPALRISADTIDVQLNWYGSGLKVQGGPEGPGPHAYTGGLMSLTKIGGTASQSNFTQTWSGDGSHPQGISAFCIDLLEHVGYDHNLYAVTALSTAPQEVNLNAAMGTDKADAIARLWRAYVNPSPDTPLEKPTTQAEIDNYQAAQLAIWEIVFEPTLTYDLNAGSFQGLGNGPITGPAPNGTVTALAQFMLVAAADTNLPKANLRAFSAPSDNLQDGFQDLVVEVPEATNVLSLAAIALVASVLNRKRLRRVLSIAG